MAGITGGVQLLDFAFFLKKKLSFTLHRAEKSSKWALNFSYAILGSQDLEAKIRPLGRVKIKISMEISTRGGGGQTRPLDIFLQ